MPVLKNDPIPAPAIQHADALSKEAYETAKKKPSLADIKAAYGEDRVKIDDKGKFTVDLHGREDMEKLKELRRPWAERALNLSHKRNGLIPTVKVIGPEGSTRTIPAHLEDQVAQKEGFKPRISGRRRRIDLSKYNPNAPLRTAAEIAGLE